MGFITILELILLLPLLLVNITLFLFLSVIIYLIVKGIEIYGILMIVIGFIFIFGSIYFAFLNFIHSKKVGYHLISFVIGLMLLIIGSLFTFDYVRSIKYYDYLPKVNIDTKTITYKEFVSNNLIVDNNDDNVLLLIDNDLNDGEVVFKVTYYEDYVSVDKKIYHISRNDKTIIDFYITSNKGIFKVLDDFVKHLKNREIYDYRKLFDFEIEVYANEKTIKKISKTWD